MNIIELDFLENSIGTCGIAGSAGAFDEISNTFDGLYKSSSDEIVGQLKAAFNSTATATNTARLTFTSLIEPPDPTKPVSGPVRLILSYRANGIATTPGT